jgi:hypothetical protein
LLLQANLKKKSGRERPLLPPITLRLGLCIIQKIVCLRAIFFSHQGCTYTDSCPFRGWIVYQINPATFVQGIALFGATVHPSQSADVIIKANFPL